MQCATTLGLPCSPTRRRLSTALLIAVVLLLVTPLAVWAHPLGNFTVNRYSRIALEQGTLRLTHIVDMAEIPAHQQRTAMDRNGDGQVDASEQEAYLATLVADLGTQLQLTLNGKPVAWSVAAQQLTFPSGQAGLPTLRVVTTWHAPLPATPTTLQAIYHDGSFADRLGWQEIIVQGTTAVKLLDSSVPATDVSAELARYPQDLLQTPLTVNEATFRFTPGVGGNGGLVAAAEAQLTTVMAPLRSGLPGDPFAELINIGTLSPLAILLALCAAFGWGAAHAFSPGHGKTVVAAYLVGARGTAAHALFLGLTTTITHTAGVFLLGLLTLFASQYILPEQLYPWLSVLSGLLVVAIGISLVRERWRSPVAVVHAHTHDHDHGPAHDHDHDHEHDHAHGHSHGLFGHHHHHGADGHSHLPPGGDGQPITWRGLLALGISGGLLPCPSALVLMLGAISLDRVGFGLALIVLFSLGLATVLSLIGVTLVYAGKYFARIPESGRLFRLLPVASAVFITVVGLGITLQALFSTGALRLA